MQLKLKNVLGKIDIIDERVETTEQELTAFVNSTTQEIETLSANMTNEIEVSFTRRRKSVPEIVNTIASDEDDDVQLIRPSHIDPNEIKEPEEPIYS